MSMGKIILGFSLVFKMLIIKCVTKLAKFTDVIKERITGQVVVEVLEIEETIFGKALNLTVNAKDLAVPPTEIHRE